MKKIVEQHKLYGNCLGLTFVECLLALVLVSVVLAPLLLGFPVGSHQGRLARHTTMAADLAQDIMEEIKSKRFDEETTSPFTDPLLLKYEGAEGDNLPIRTAFDDVDDYHDWPDYDGSLHPNDTTVPAPVGMQDGLSLDRFSEFTREVIVDYVSYNDVEKKWDHSDAATNYKRIRVYVSGPYNPTVMLCTLAAFH